MATLHRALGLAALSFAGAASCESGSPTDDVGTGGTGGGAVGGSGGAGGTGGVNEPSGYLPVAPYRRVDTRDTSPIAAGEQRCWTIAAEDAPIPENATAVAVNLVAVAPKPPAR